MDKVKILVEKVEGLALPKYESESASGMDVRVNFDELSVNNAMDRIKGRGTVYSNEGEVTGILLRKGDRYLFPTGLKVAVPIGYEIQVRSRSGLALKKGVAVLNGIGTIDADYRGEIGVILMNHSDSSVLIEDDERIAQLVVAPVAHADWINITTLPKTKRGGDGFGSSGK